jgi:hypothetical protein
MDAVVFMIFLKALSSHFNAASLSLASLAVEPSATLFGKAQVTWEFVTLPIPRLGNVGLTATYWGNVGVVVENLNKWLPANNSALKVRYLVSDGLLNYGLSLAGIKVGDSIQVNPGERIEITNINLGLLSGKLIVLVYVSAETVAQGATPQTFSGDLPTSATFVPSSNVQLNTTFYIKPIIRLQGNTTLGSVNLDFPLEPKKGAQVSLKINRVILHSNCGTWINLTTGDPPYKPPRALTPNETTVCVLSRVLEEKQTAAGYEIYAEYINPAATPSWQPSSIVVVPTGSGSSASQIGVWQIALWAVVGVAAFLAAYLLTGFIFNRRGAKLK